MNILQVVISVFLVLESLNVIVLYRQPSMKQGNGIGVFKVVEEIEHQERIFSLIKYLTTWIANAKLIFVALGIVIVIFGDEVIQLYAAFAFVFSILLFYITLYPILKRLDDKGEIIPKGYSKTLAYTILSFVLTFIVGIIIYYSI
jgi:hypothetical protein